MPFGASSLGIIVPIMSFIPLGFVRNRVLIPLGFIKNRPFIPLGFIKNEVFIPLGFIRFFQKSLLFPI